MRAEIEQVVALLQRGDDQALEQALALLQNTVFSFSMRVTACFKFVVRLAPVLLLTAFVGLNLLPSGFTDWCPLMTLARKLGVKS